MSHICWACQATYGGERGSGKCPRCENGGKQTLTSKERSLADRILEISEQLMSTNAIRARELEEIGIDVAHLESERVEAHDLISRFDSEISSGNVPDRLADLFEKLRSASETTDRGPPHCRHGVAYTEPCGLCTGAGAGHFYSPRPGDDVCCICGFHKSEHAPEHMPAQNGRIDGGIRRVGSGAALRRSR